MILVDSEERSKATDPGTSFIVQAPAGSGKTEILTQRYLRLLSTVKVPEQIIALTFTRKAAREMRERIIIALKQAALNEKAQSTHQQKTLDFAKEALKHAQTNQWDILEQANRLRISTIDSLCQSINQSIPLLEKQIAYSDITENPQKYYLKAARSCIDYALNTEEYQDAIKTILLHVDNRQEKLVQLFTSMLGQRDQWLSPLFLARQQNKTHFEHAISLIQEHELRRFRTSLPQDLAQDLVALSRDLASVENNPDSLRYPLKSWFRFEDSNPEIATALCALILGSDQQFRKSFDHHVGLIKSECSEDDYSRLKGGSANLLTRLSDFPEFHKALLQVSNLPNPQYNSSQWEVLQALFVLLPVLASHLHILFAKDNCVDFTAIAQQALYALGDEDQPTDLALYLDNQIQHLLVDEFQDTSITQFELLSKLVQGWSPNEGKTLFLVGDPMQSIYRFRQAEVGLFFRAQEQGIGPIRLTPLELRSNFRSNKIVVQWVNKQFSYIFPKQFDIESGAVSFHPSAHVLESDTKSSVQAIACESKEQEAELLIRLIKQEAEDHPDQDLAILVRSRTHLEVIITLLRKNKIAYQGSDIDLLANLYPIQDAWSLTSALLSPGNRLSWLALLHSPYCGLILDDIHAIAQYNPKKSIYYALKNCDHITELSDEGRIRASYFYSVMSEALDVRYQTSLSQWVIDTFKKLHAEKIISPSEIQDLEQYWVLLDQYSEQGRIPDLKEFLSALKTLYSKQASPSRIQIMTIHKSKGLEFDTVFIPSLGAQPNRGDNPLLRFLKMPTKEHGDLLLFSPIKAADQDSCLLYDYITKLEEEKSYYEMQRLFYVAATRAKSRLYLLDSSTKSYKGSFRSLLHQQEFYQEEQKNQLDHYKRQLPPLYRLPLNYYIDIPANTNYDPNNILFELSRNLPQLCGIIIHRMIHWICEHHLTDYNKVPWNLVHHELNKSGLSEQSKKPLFHLIQQNIKALLSDPKGLWITAPHQAEQNEYELLVEDKNSVHTRIIDRCFVDNNHFWIVDFKSGTEDEATIRKHQKQVNDYAYYISKRIDLPICCGLYYLSTLNWLEWHYRGTLVE